LVVPKAVTFLHPGWHVLFCSPHVGFRASQENERAARSDVADEATCTSPEVSAAEEHVAAIANATKDAHKKVGPHALVVKLS
jgi:hypothetical protein